MNIEVECFGPAMRWCGVARLWLELRDDAKVSDALNSLAARFPELAARRATLAIAIDDAIVMASAPLSEGRRLALIPPVSGG